MKEKPKVSLCLPTNGKPEWVLPAVESIYAQNVDENLFEVIITDNGAEDELGLLLQKYMQKQNFIYKRTNSVMFENVIDAYKMANGVFIKFVNNKMQLLPGALQHFVEFVCENEEKKPLIYFANGSLEDKYREEIWHTNSFDDFVKNLGIQNSNGDGIAIWKEDFDLLDLGALSNILFPDMPILYSQRNKDEFIIDNSKWSEKKITSHAQKGKYDLYYAFSVEYLALLLELLRTDDISLDCFLKLKEDAKTFIYKCYLDFNIRKKPCSYNIDNFDKSMQVYYGKQNKIYELIKVVVRIIIKKITR